MLKRKQLVQRWLCNDFAVGQMKNVWWKRKRKRVDWIHCGAVLSRFSDLINDAKNEPVYCCCSSCCSNPFYLLLSRFEFCVAKRFLISCERNWTGERGGGLKRQMSKHICQAYCVPSPETCAEWNCMCWLYHDEKCSFMKWNRNEIGPLLALLPPFKL